jgi:hypothetical protein
LSLLKTLVQTLKLTRAGHITQLQEHRKALLESVRNSDERRLLKFGYRVYSQADEDGIIREIFRRIGGGVAHFWKLGRATAWRIIRCSC